jgi:hypothetical protein
VLRADCEGVIPTTGPRPAAAHSRRKRLRGR